MKTLLVSVALSACCWAAPAGNAAKSAIFVFGPGGAEPAKRGALGATSAAKSWVKSPDSWAELRRLSDTGDVVLEAKTPGKQIDDAFAAASREARDSDSTTFVTRMDAAAQALALRPGVRLLVGILEAPPLSGEAESTLARLVEYCRDKSVRIVLFDTTDATSKKSSTVLEKVAADTGGMLARSPTELNNAMLVASSTPPPTESVAVPVVADTTGLPTDIPVKIRFLKTSSRGMQSHGTERSFGSGGGPAGGGITTQEGGPNMDLTTGPIRGLLVVEAPMSALKFEMDPGERGYLAKVRMTQIVRNSRGQVAWRATKDITIHGPAGQLEERKAGNLYFMREVGLPGAKYTLEGMAEDLLASKSGGVRVPLQTSDGVPGFAVSDAVFVRPFNGHKDQFEADQIFAYDGEAYSPMLGPVFKANEPFDLRIYLVMYPDLYGSQPELSLEVLYNGRVAGRTKLPFTDLIRDTSRDGVGASKGEQKSKFPYLATLKGAKLTPGDFVARVTVRQDKNVTTRDIPFRVAGDGTERAAVATPGPALIQAPAEEDLSGIVLPEIDPVTVHSGGPAATPEEVKALWDEAAANAMGYSAGLPNFRCEQETHRLTAPVKNADKMHEDDVFVEEVTYENGRESYQTLEVNGLKSDKNRTSLRGTKSRGEFGTMLRSLLSPEVGAKYQWSGRAMAGGVLCRVFEVQVPVEKSNFVLYFNTRQEVAGYSGMLFVEESTGLVRRLTIKGEGLPKDFGLQSPALSMEYGLVKIGDVDHLLPLRSVLQVRQGKILVRNEASFRKYRRFEATSNIKFN
jgi:hypothetical protein